MMRPRVLVTGARGMLGTDLRPALAAQGYEVVAADLAEFDLTDPLATTQFIRASAPAIVLNCAAYTAVDLAESDSETAYRINRDGVQHLASAAQQIGAALLHLSTDYVFDGTKEEPYTEDDPPHPQTVYGASKLAGEEAVRATLEEYWIIRTAWLYGLHGKSFPYTILTTAASGHSLRVVNDQRGCPTYTVHLAQALATIIAQPNYGTYHVVNTGACTWYDLACVAVEIAGLQADITPVSTAAYPRPAPRPKNCVLDTTKLSHVYGLQLPPWQEGLAAFVQQWRHELPVF